MQSPGSHHSHRQSPLVEDVRTAKKAGLETDQRIRSLDFSSKVEVASREEQTSDPPDTEEVGKTDDQTNLEDALIDTLESRAYTVSEAPGDMSEQEHDMVGLDYLFSAEFVDPPWADMTDGKHGDIPSMDPTEHTRHLHAPVFTDFLENQPSQQDPTLFALEEGDWYSSLSHGSWDGPRTINGIHAIVIWAVHSTSNQVQFHSHPASPSPLLTTHNSS